MEGRLKGTLVWVVSSHSSSGKKIGIIVVKPLEDLTSAGGLLACTTASSKLEPYGIFTRSMEGFSRARERISFSSRPWLVSCQTALFFFFFRKGKNATTTAKHIHHVHPVRVLTAQRRRHTSGRKVMSRGRIRGWLWARAKNDHPSQHQLSHQWPPIGSRWGGAKAKKES